MTLGRTKILRKLSWAVGTVSVVLVLAMVYYLLFMLLVNTDVEKRLASENEMYRGEVERVEKNLGVMLTEIEYLESRDARIYRSLFDTDVPVEGLVDGNQSVGDTYKTMSSIDENWQEIFSMLSQGTDVSAYPVRYPLSDLVHTNVGASTGMRMNPFYKVKVQHDGVDLVAAPGTSVLAVADGVVTKVSKSAGGLGNVVEITHAGGYVTRYAHLSTVFVKQGRRVKAGEDVIGQVGDSGRTFATHLHYELRKDGQVLDPVGYFVSSANPFEYFDMVLDGASVAQSMD